MDPTHQGFVSLREKGLFTRWKKHYCAVYTNSHYGVSRLEIYRSQSDFEHCKHGKNVLLSRCVAVRTIVTDNDRIPRAVSLTTDNTRKPQILIGCCNADEAQVWQDALSRAAFPENYAALVTNQNSSNAPVTPGSAPGSPLEEQSYDIPWDVHQIRVMLMPTASSRRLGLGEGTYDLNLNSDALLLKSDHGIIEAWDYKVITWFGYGDKCFCFEAEGNQLFEFRCARPEQVYEWLRTPAHLYPDPDSEHRPTGLQQSYYARYMPKALIDKAKAARTVVAPRLSVDSIFAAGIHSLARSKSDISDWKPGQKIQRRAEKSASISLSPRSLDGQQPPSRTKRLFSIFRSKRGKRSKTPETPSIAEEADDEWSYQTPAVARNPSPPPLPPDLVMTRDSVVEPAHEYVPMMSIKQAPILFPRKTRRSSEEQVRIRQVVPSQPEAHRATVGILPGANERTSVISISTDV